MKKAYSEQINKEMAAQLETIINQNKAKTAELSNFKADNPTAIAGAVQSLASTKPAETEKIIKALPPLMVEYAGKPYGNGKTISVDYSTFGKTFYLKNGEENAETTWLFKSGEEIIKSFAGNLTSIDIDFTEFDAEKLEVYHKTGMYFEVTQGERKVKVMVSTQKLVLEKLTIEDAKHPSRKATNGQTLYLVGEGKINANVSATGFQNPFTNPNLSWWFEGRSNPLTQFDTKSNITIDLGSNPPGFDERKIIVKALNAIGDDKNVMVKVVDYARVEDAYGIIPKSIDDKLKQITNLDKWLNKGNIKEYFKNNNLEIKFKYSPKSVSYNKENNKDRFYSHFKTGTAPLAISFAKKDIPVYSLSVPYFDVDLGFFMTLSAEMGLEYSIDQIKSINESSYKVKQNFAVKGKGEVEITFKLPKVKNKWVQAEFKTYGKTGLYAEGGLKDFTGDDRKLYFECGFNGLVAGVSAKFATVDGFELIDYKKEVYLFPKTKLYATE